MEQNTSPVTDSGTVPSVEMELDGPSKNEAAQEKAIAKICKGILNLHVKMGEKYLQLCTYIRENEVVPFVVRKTLSEHGFPMPTISEILTISYAKDTEWDMYAAKKLGYKKMLELVRDNKRTEAGRLLLAEDAISEDEITSMEEPLDNPNWNTTSGLAKKSDADKRKEHALALIELSRRTGQYRFKGQKYMVLVVKNDKYQEERVKAEESK